MVRFLGSLHPVNHLRQVELDVVPSERNDVDAFEICKQISDILSPLTADPKPNVLRKSSSEGDEELEHGEDPFRPPGPVTQFFVNAVQYEINNGLGWSMDKLIDDAVQIIRFLQLERSKRCD